MLSFFFLVYCLISTAFCHPVEKRLSERTPDDLQVEKPFTDDKEYEVHSAYENKNDEENDGDVDYSVVEEDVAPAVSHHASHQTNSAERHQASAERHLLEPIHQAVLHGHVTPDAVERWMRQIKDAISRGSLESSTVQKYLLRMAKETPSLHDVFSQCCWFG